MAEYIPMQEEWWIFTYYLSLINEEILAIWHGSLSGLVLCFMAYKRWPGKQRLDGISFVYVLIESPSCF
ncbi:hypothetical protein CDAR_35341 [Caerostris darwini]|uniref:Uncharacterized protein n=1 Tax=Caerostris darwini TaxID=1538125 RepID=A0AAV4SLJ7_9ARAC|nr:hypothetical protein CDAR_35341 [Caerostris darwini]